MLRRGGYRLRVLDESRDRNEVARLRSRAVSYMEIAGHAGGFSCGSCTWPKDGYCENPRVRAEISPSHGCCNLFYPAGEKPVFPPDTKRPRRA